LPGVELPWGAFGENLTTHGDGLVESSVRIGDRLSIGTVELVVTQPRLPCYKLGLRLGTDAPIRRMVETGRSGFYCAVEREGEIGVGDPVTIAARDEAAPTVAQVFRLGSGGEPSEGDDEREILRRAVEARALPAGWRRRFLDRLEALEG
jgi:MOSC domain-containing protein YiiM